LGRKEVSVYFEVIVIEKAVVGDARKCTTCRECIRHDKFKDKIEIAKIKDRFEFHVESVGIYKPEDIFIEALKKLKEKANYWMDVLEQEGEKDDIEEIDLSRSPSKK
jgi:DNA-directed RNA polymerase alpha subunit